MTTLRRLLLASNNPGKLVELQALLRGLPVEVTSRPDLPEVAETGETFLENAILKACAAATWSGEWALADDSGLEVDALGGAPGVRSRRYAGRDATDAERNARLLARLAKVPDPKRTARFRCVLALMGPDGRVWTAEGVCEGRITHAPRGEHGFGYDPIFQVAGLDRTMAELTPEEKDRLSHRARALAAMAETLRTIAGEISG